MPRDPDGDDIELMSPRSPELMLCRERPGDGVSSELSGRLGSHSTVCNSFASRQFYLICFSYDVPT